MHGCSVNYENMRNCIKVQVVGMLLLLLLLLISVTSCR